MVYWYGGFGDSKMDVKAGDRLTLKASVEKVHDAGHLTVIVGATMFVLANDSRFAIKSVEPAPPGVGDTVTWGTGIDHLKVVAISKTQIVTRWEERDKFEVNYLPLDNFCIIKRANS